MISHRQNRKIAQTIKATRKASDRGGRPESYPWTEWFDGQTRKLVRGKTYHCSDKSMQKSIYAAASRRSYPVSITVVEDGIILSPKKVPDPTTAQLV